MPFQSKAQQRLMYAAASKKGGVAGVSQKAAKSFISHSKSTNFKRLPQHVKGGKK